MIYHIFSPVLCREKWTSKRLPLASWTRIGNSLPNPTKGYGLVARSGYHTQTRVQRFSPLPVSWVDFYCSTKRRIFYEIPAKSKYPGIYPSQLKNMLDDFPTKPLSRIVSQGALWLFFLFAKKKTQCHLKRQKIMVQTVNWGRVFRFKTRIAQLAFGPFWQLWHKPWNESSYCTVDTIPFRTCQRYQILTALLTQF